ncbi:MAG: hypothetical protein KKB08_20175, partial [Gammaproteobacteria bacterium]|nr:hypothetical protein [Gammaproteobacteria bacterium]
SKVAYLCIGANTDGIRTTPKRKLKYVYGTGRSPVVTSPPYPDTFKLELDGFRLVKPTSF